MARRRHEVAIETPKELTPSPTAALMELEALKEAVHHSNLVWATSVDAIGESRLPIPFLSGHLGVLGVVKRGFALGA